MLWVFVFSTLRHHTGGLHTHSQFSCIACSTLFAISNSFFIYFPFVTNNIFKICTYLILILFFFLAIPVPSHIKPLTLAQHRKNKCQSIQLLTVAFVFSMLLPRQISSSNLRFNLYRIISDSSSC
jgi:accessory gene regulator protein AgrB